MSEHKFVNRFNAMQCSEIIGIFISIFDDRLIKQSGKNDFKSLLRQCTVWGISRFFEGFFLSVFLSLIHKALNQERVLLSAETIV